MPFRSDDHEELNEAEFPEPDKEGNGHAEMVRCPACRGLIWAEVDVCPRCGHFILEDDTRTRPWWLIVGVLACLLVTLYWIWPR
jgi:hypothetical protein